jgi:hypothetical protein
VKEGAGKREKGKGKREKGKGKREKGEGKYEGCRYDRAFRDFFKPGNSCLMTCQIKSRSTPR